MTRILDIESICSVCGKQLPLNQAGTSFVCQSCQDNLIGGGPNIGGLRRVTKHKINYFMYIFRFHEEWAIDYYYNQKHFDPSTFSQLREWLSKGYVTVEEVIEAGIHTIL